VWNLPVIFVCENNLYATEVAFAKATKNSSVASRGQAYDLPGVEVDGNDVVAVYEVAGEAVRRARAGEGPTLLECKTYRTRAHSEGMRDTGYRTGEEVNEWKARCPIKLFKKQLLADKIVDETEIEAVEAEIKTLMAEAVAFAEQSPWPDPATMTDHLYSQEGCYDA
jgi:2-oxoisovalerate dehydrogenase E1 component